MKMKGKGVRRGHEIFLFLGEAVTHVYVHLSLSLAHM